MIDKVDEPESVNAVEAALSPSISELRGRHTQRLPHSPIISKCQVSDCYYKPIDENKNNEQN